MKKGLFKELISFSLVLTLGFAWMPQAMMIHAEETAETKENVQQITVSAEMIAQRSAYYAIQSALDQAKTYEGMTEITVEAGTYDLSYGLCIYSNTILNLDGVTLLRKRDINMLHIGDYDGSDPSTVGNTGVTGYYWHDITVKGGTFDAEAGTTVMIKGAHAKNITFEDVTFTDTVDAHLMEMAAIDGLNVIGCTFTDMILKKSGYYEAIQLDVLVPVHFNGYRAEPLACKNVTVKDCLFERVPRGIGSHTNILNVPMDGITIENNTFRNLTSAAIQGSNWSNVLIKDNLIDQCPRGVYMFTINGNGDSESASGSYTAAWIDSIGNTSSGISSSYIAPSDSHTVITGNTMNLTGKDAHANYVNTAIRLGGSNYKTKTVDSSDQSGNIPTGNYYFNGAEVSNNIINANGHGIVTVNARNVKITGNTIDCVNYPSGDNTNYYGVQLYTGSQAVSVENNIISRTKSNGIMVHESCSASKINGNTINNAGLRGIMVENSKATEINSNTVNNPADIGIYISAGSGSASATSICYNTVNNAGERSITANGATVTRISNNTVNKSKKDGIWILNSARVTEVENNFISLKQGGAGDTSGIVVGGATASYIRNNIIDSAGMRGINCAGGASSTKISNNKICNPGSTYSWIYSDSFSYSSLAAVNKWIRFSDVLKQSDYYYTPVYWAAAKAIANGYDDGTFGPKKNCTREQMMTFLWRLAGKPEPKSSSNPFPDIKSSDYYYKAVLWGVQQGITNGYSSGPYKGKFGVGVACTREQAMTFLWRLAKKPEPKTDENRFADLKETDYYYKPVLWAAENGIANGYSSGTYAGKYGVGLACQREHMVTFLYRYALKY